MVTKWTVPRYWLAALPKTSLTVTSTEPATPAVAAAGNPPTAMVVGAPGLTVMAVWEPAIVAVTASVAVTLKVATALASLS